MKFLIGLLVALGVTIGGFFGIESVNQNIDNQVTLIKKDVGELRQYVFEKQNTLLGASIQLFAGFPYTLSGSGVSSSATSITITSLTLPQNDYEIQDSDLSETFYITFEPGNPDRQEIVSCTTVTQSGSDATATLSGCTRGLSPISPYTASSTLQFSHGGGTKLIFSDPPQVFQQYAAKDNEETITRTWTFDADDPPRLDATGKTATSSAQLISKEYADGLAIAGAPDSSATVKGLLEKGSALEAASSTADGSGNTTAPLALTTSISSARCTVKGQAVVVTRTDGRISPNCVSTSTAYSFYGISVLGGNNSFGGATTTLTATKPTFGIGTSTPSVNGLSNAGNTYLSRGVGIGDATTTRDANLYVAGHSIFANTATTSKLIVSKCVGCINGYERITGAAHDCTTGATSCSSTATCSTGKIVIGGGFTYVQNTQVTAAGGYPSGDTTFIGQITCTTNCGSASVVGYAICAYP